MPAHTIGEQYIRRLLVMAENKKCDEIVLVENKETFNSRIPTMTVQEYIVKINCDRQIYFLEYG